MSVQIALPKCGQNVVVLDIDGCIIDSSARLPLLIAGDRDAYNAAHGTDTTIPHGVALYKALMANHEAVFVTSRREDSRAYTIAQLEMAMGDTEHPFQLLMRPTNMEGVADEVFKPWILKEHGIFLSEIVMAVDDRQSMVTAWRALGVPCIQPVADNGMHLPATTFEIEQVSK